MPLLKCKATAAALVGQADQVVEGVLSAVYVPPNLPAGFTFVIEEVVDGYAHVLYTFSAPASPAKYPLQRQSKKYDGSDSGVFLAELVGGHLQVRSSVPGTYSLLVL